MQPNNNLNPQQIVRDIKKTLESDIVYSGELIEQFSKELESLKEELKNLKENVLTLKIYSYKKLEIKSEELEEKVEKLTIFNKINKALSEKMQHINYLKAYIMEIFNNTFKIINAQNEINNACEKTFFMNYVDVNIINGNCIIKAKKYLKETKDIVKVNTNKILDLLNEMQKQIEKAEIYLDENI